jgi:hypothetical protein
MAVDLLSQPANLDRKRQGIGKAFEFEHLLPALSGRMSYQIPAWQVLQ